MRRIIGSALLALMLITGTAARLDRLVTYRSGRTPQVFHRDDLRAVNYWREYGAGDISLHRRRAPPTARQKQHLTRSHSHIASLGTASSHLTIGSSLDMGSGTYP